VQRPAWCRAAVFAHARELVKIDFELRQILNVKGE
jgi:hypothetical protein